MSAGRNERMPPRRSVRTKPYKAAAPEDTIRDIQSRLEVLGLSFAEQSFEGESGRYAYGLWLVDDVRGDPVFQTNGKGRTDTYARASAYGEMTNALNDEFATCYLEFDRHVHVLTNPYGATPLQREDAIRAVARYAEAAPSRRFAASDYLMFYPRHPFVPMSQSEFQEFVIQRVGRDRVTDIPACFHCTTCGSSSNCNYPFLSGVWKRMKQAMTRSAWTQDDMRRAWAGWTSYEQPAARQNGAPP